jgi:LPS O-antigen subunit length determinant protein (WzzB/FepE family)
VIDEPIEVTASDIRKYKTGWKNQYKEVTYIDELSKEENAAFKGDSEFERLILDVKMAEDEVYTYMNKKIRDLRIEQAVKIAQIKPIKEPDWKEPFE